MRVHIVTVLFTLCSPVVLLHAKSSDLRWAQSKAVLDTNGDLLLKWKVDYLIRKIQFEIVLSDKAPAFRWFALGFSNRGEFANSDVCVLWTDYKGRMHFEDMHSDSCSKLSSDKQQDCEGFYVANNSKSIVFERYFDTCDKDDYVIEEDTVHVIWARGKDKLFSSKGVCLAGTRPEDHGFIRVRLLTIPGKSKVEGLPLAITNKNLKVPGADTTYWCKIVKLPDFVVDIKHHIVQFESKITKGNEGLVHHMELFGCGSNPDLEMPMFEGNCFSPDRPKITKRCSKVKAAWAMGAPAFSYPAEAGLPLGGRKQNMYVMLEVHYNNPTLKKDWVDSSGIIVYITPILRKYDAAIMELGLEYTDKMAIPGGQVDFTLTGHCVPQCTSVGLPRNGIVVFGSQLHTHLTGIAVWTRHFRQGIELPLLNKDTHYSTHFQEIRILHHPVTILPGDYLETSCMYNTVGRINATIGGHAITDEMCVNYIHYYPATDLEVCKSSVSDYGMEYYFNMERKYDRMKIPDKATPREKYLSIKPWNLLRAEALNLVYSKATISMQCDNSDGNPFQGDWKEMEIPKTETIIQLPPRICPGNPQYGRK